MQEADATVDFKIDDHVMWTGYDPVRHSRALTGTTNTPANSPSPSRRRSGPAALDESSMQHGMESGFGVVCGLPDRGIEVQFPKAKVTLPAHELAKADARGQLINKHKTQQSSSTEKAAHESMVKLKAVNLLRSAVEEHRPDDTGSEKLSGVKKN